MDQSKNTWFATEKAAATADVSTGHLLVCTKRVVRTVGVASSNNNSDNICLNSTLLEEVLGPKASSFAF